MSYKQRRIIHSAVSKLELSQTRRDEIESLTWEFHGKYQNEFHDRRTIKEIVIEEEALEDLSTNFERDLDKLFTRIKNKYQNEELSLQIAKFQLQVMSKFKEEFFPPESIPGLPKDPDYYKRIYKKLIPANRPSYESYDSFLFELSEIIKSEKKAYIPIIVNYLKTLRTKEITIFKNFEINTESIRMKLSKHRRGINKVSNP